MYAVKHRAAAWFAALVTASAILSVQNAHGLIDLGIGMPALGTVKLSDLAAIVGPRQQPVMRDRYFQPVRRLSEYLRLAEDNGSITD